MNSPATPPFVPAAATPDAPLRPPPPRRCLFGRPLSPGPGCPRSFGSLWGFDDPNDDDDDAASWPCGKNGGPTMWPSPHPRKLLGAAPLQRPLPSPPASFLSAELESSPPPVQPSWAPREVVDLTQVDEETEVETEEEEDDVEEEEEEEKKEKKRKRADAEPQCERARVLYQRAKNRRLTIRHADLFVETDDGTVVCMKCPGKNMEGKSLYELAEIATRGL